MAKVKDTREVTPVPAEVGDVLVCWKEEARSEADHLMIIQTTDDRYNLLAIDTSTLLFEESSDSLEEIVRKAESDYWFVDVIDETDVTVTLA